MDGDYMPRDALERHITPPVLRFVHIQRLFMLLYVSVAIAKMGIKAILAMAIATLQCE